MTVTPRQLIHTRPEPSGRGDPVTGWPHPVPAELSILGDRVHELGTPLRIEQNGINRPKAV